PAHGISDTIERLGKGELGELRRRLRNVFPKWAELTHITMIAVPAGDDHVRFGADRLPEQVRDKLRRMLKVGVHYAHPRRLSDGNTERNRTTQAARAVIRRTVPQLNRGRRM